MRPGIAHLAVLLSATGIGLAVPALAPASSGGGGLAGSPPPSSGSSGSSTSPGTGQVTGSAGGMTITTTAAGFLNSQIRFAGHADPSNAGHLIEIERLGHETGWSWAPTVQTRVRSDGSYSVQWQANHIGQFSIRPVLGHGSGGGSAAGGEPTVSMIIYRPAVATWYNQAGTTTACGVRLRAGTLGVAHRTLPCGTKVAFDYHGRTLVLPVIDRGPYGHADWDLTEAAAGKLGMKEAGIVTLGSASLPPRR